MFILPLLACTDGTYTDSSDTGGSGTVETLGDCPDPAPTGDELVWSQLEGLGYVTWETGIHVLQSEADFAAAFPDYKEASGIDFTSSTAVVAAWSIGGCEWPSVEVTRAVLADGLASVEFTFDHRGNGGCDMGVLASLAITFAHTEPAEACLVTITGL